jgi:transcriptional regulator NrdR family protein
MPVDHRQHCPKCGSPETYRSHRKPVEYLLLGCRSFCCVDCKKRFRTFDMRKVLQWSSSSS